MLALIRASSHSPVRWLPAHPTVREPNIPGQMKNSNKYFLEFLFLGLVLLVTVTGFWDIYFGANPKPNSHHHLHVITNFLWLFLLIWQLRLISTNNFRQHRKTGLVVLFLAPLIVATTALLSVHSAHKGVVSGNGDMLIVQNVGVTLELGLVILLAFVVRKRRKLHASFLLSTGILFMGIALFFSLISFAPQFKIEGPETFHRFQSAGITGQAIVLVLGLVFVIKDWRNGWPMFLAAVFFLLNEVVRSHLAKNDLIQPLTEIVGSMSQPLTFIGTFAVLLALLVATGVLGGRGLMLLRAGSGPQHQTLSGTSEDGG